MDAEERAGVCLNLANNAPSQYADFNFNSMTVWNGIPFGANEDGIFSLFDEDADDGVEILSIVEFPTGKFGTSAGKRFRKLFFVYESSGKLLVRTVADDDTERDYMLEENKIGQRESKSVLNGARDVKGTNLMIRIENINGCDFSLDLIQALLIVLSRTR
jgi:hypothetical protein